jgi:hypothetical protein
VEPSVPYFEFPLLAIPFDCDEAALAPLVVLSTATQITGATPNLDPELPFLG